MLNIKKQISRGLIGAALMAVCAVGVAPLAHANDVPRHEDAPQCGVLPQAICNASNEAQLNRSGIWLILIMVINIMTVGVGIAAVAAIAFAGFLYTTAQNDAAQTKKALEMIRNTVIGIVVYALFFAGVNFLVPGGVFGTRVDDGGGSGSGRTLPTPPGGNRPE